MTDNNYAHGQMGTKPTTSESTRDTLPARTMQTANLTVAGDQHITVRSHHGATETNFFSGRCITVTIATLVVYCHTLDTLNTLTQAWRDARSHVQGLPVTAHPRVQDRLKLLTNSDTIVTSAVTFHAPMGCHLTPVGGSQSPDGHPSLTISTGPLGVTVRDQTSLHALADAWDAASQAADALWVQGISRVQEWPYRGGNA